MEEPTNRHQDPLGESLGWKWFEYHAKQRVDMFKYYLTIIFATLVGAGTLIDKQFYKIALVFGLLAIFASALFWSLDVRSRRLTEIGERIIAHAWTTRALPEHLNPITQAASHTDGLRFKHAFGLTYFVGGAVGAIVIFIALSATGAFKSFGL